MKTKLPAKQWKHWCKKAGLRPYDNFYGRKPLGWYDLKGHGRMWRLNCHNMLQCGDTYEEFDRWAMSEIVELPCPTSEYEFMNAVYSMLNKYQSA